MLVDARAVGAGAPHRVRDERGSDPPAVLARWVGEPGGRPAAAILTPLGLRPNGVLRGHGRAAGRRRPPQAAVGAAVGLVADLALAGLSLGAATALGAAVGGLASQGWSQVPRKIANRFRGIEELTLENDVLLVLADSMVKLCAALEQRGHAAWAKVHVAPTAAGAENDNASLQGLVASLAPARSYPQWERAIGSLFSADARRAALVERVAQGLRAVAEPPEIVQKK